jgi:enamine deaminase RidA (YjgF/YER057c/UK114 family)
VAGCGGSQEEQGSQEEETTAAAPETTGGGGSTTSAAAQGGGDATAQVVAATEAFLATLDDAQREEATFDFDDELKTNWSNFPVPVVPRNGVALGDMTEEQQQAALAILQAALSEEGYQKTIGNMVDDQVNQSLEGEPDLFSANLYYFAVFGTPSETEPWMLQYGGHHYAINLTVSGQDNVFTPSFVGVQPSEYTLDQAADMPAFVPVDVLGSGTIRPMTEENDLAFELINALDPEQQEQVILDYEVTDLVLGPDENVRVLEPEGIPASEITADQQAMLLDLIRQWAGIANEEAAEERMSEI